MKLKKTIPLSILLFFFTMNLIAQINETTPPPPPPPPPPPNLEVEEIFTVIEGPIPSFPGCEKLEEEEEKRTCSKNKLNEYVYAHLEYPEIAKSNGVEGTVVITFVLAKDGSVTNPRILKDIGAQCGKAGLAVVQKMQEDKIHWFYPEKQKKPVKVQFNLPIKFELPKEEKNAAVSKQRDKKLTKRKVIKKDFFKDKDLSSEDASKNEPPPPPPLQSQKEENFQVVEKMPSFPGCENITDKHEKKKCSNEKLLSYMSENLIYPEVAKAKGIEGKVVVTFVVGKDGLVNDAKLLKEIGGGCGKAALDLVNKMRTDKVYWEPGMNRGKSVNVQFNLPVNFKLPKKGPEQSENQDETVYQVVEEMPRFPGCEDLTDKKERKKCADKKMLMYISSNVRYPPVARDNGVEGVVVVSFQIKPNGSISNARILRDIGAGCGDEVLRVVNAMNKKGFIWIPGKQRGKAVTVQYNVPFKFTSN